MKQNYSIKELTAEEFRPLLAAHKQSVFKDTHSYEFQGILSKAELEHMKELAKATGAPYKLFLGVFDKEGQFVGWSWGLQENATTFYMVNSAILPAHRRKGLYSLLLNRCIELLSAKGFQLIYSRHCATNNSIIIPKLKVGFIISKMEIDDTFGILIHLHFYTNKGRRKIMDYRAGQLKPDEEIRKAFKI